MTLIAALVTPRFAFVMSDTRASVLADVACVLADGRPHLIKAGESFTTQKFWLSADQRDLVAASGDLVRHGPLATFALLHKGFAVDEILSGGIFGAMNQFGRLPVLPPDTQLPQESFVHVWEEESRFLLTKVEAHLALAHRETWRSKAAGTAPVAIGSGGPPLLEALAAPSTDTSWDTLHAKPDATPEEYRAFLLPRFEQVATTVPDVGAPFRTLVLEPGRVWREIA